MSNIEKKEKYFYQTNTINHHTDRTSNSFDKTRSYFTHSDVLRNQDMKLSLSAK